MLQLATLKQELESAPFMKASGRVIALKGPMVTARIPHAAVGNLCYIHTRNILGKEKHIAAQVVAFEEDLISLAPYDSIEGISPGACVTNTGTSPKLSVSNNTIGSVLDSLGNVLWRDDASSDLEGLIKGAERNIFGSPPNPLVRAEIEQLLPTGISAIDGLCSVGYGQRIGLFAGAGTGKSTLLGMIARNAQVDINVIALVGERGREVNEFIKHCIGADGLKKSVVVVSTSDESPIRRSLAPLTATAIAEHFREQGKRVLLLVDSLTRVARAMRDVGLASGELPVRQGYTSSVYTQLPKLLERAGNDSSGSITAIYTVLTNGEGESDPLGEEIKSLLDGHVVLDSQVARDGIRPAIDISGSISRLLPKLHSNDNLAVIEEAIGILSKLKKDRDILLLGGTPDDRLKACLAVEKDFKKLLNQSSQEYRNPQETFLELKTIVANYRNLLEKP